MDQPLVSFIILTCNRRQMVVHAIASAEKQRYPRKEITVVDNGSRDGTVDFLRSSFPGVKVVACRTNIGVPAARNRAILASRGEFLIFLDDDCVLNGEDSAGIVVSNFLADSRCGAVAFRIVDPVTRNEWPYNLHEGEVHPIAYECAVFRGGGVALRRKTLDEVGLFWEPLFIVHEDTDLSLRIIHDGWRIVGRGDVVVWHPTPDTNSPNLRREIYYKVRNTIWLVLRAVPVSLMPVFLGPTCVRAFNLAMRTGRLWLFIRALLDSLREAAGCIRDRRPVTRAWVKRARQLSMKLWT